MKVNLLIDGYPINGYLNLDPLAQPNDALKINHGLENLDDIIDNNECVEFLAKDVIDAFPLPTRDSILKHWMSKIEHDGIFVLSGLDINKVSRLIVSSDMNVIDVNNMVYGPCKNIWSMKKGIWSMNDAVNSILSTNQFRVFTKSFNGPNYIIKAQRL